MTQIGVGRQDLLPHRLAVLAVGALGDGLDDARRRAYDAAGKVSFDGMHYRTDIGAD